MIDIFFLDTQYKQIRANVNDSYYTSRLYLYSGRFLFLRKILKIASYHRAYHIDSFVTSTIYLMSVIMLRRSREKETRDKYLHDTRI